jgi:hypothetical protein
VDGVQLEDITGPGGDDRVDADAGQVRAGDRSPGDDEVGVRGLDDVPPRRHSREESKRVEAERDRERYPVDIGQVVEERLSRVDDLSHGNGA